MWRRWWFAATIAVVVVVGAVFGGPTLLGSGTSAPSPTTTAHKAPGAPLRQQIVGLWKGVDPAFPDTLLFRADGTVMAVVRSDELLGRTAAQLARVDRYSVSGDTLVIGGRALTGLACDYTFVARRLADGWVQLSEQSPSSTNPTSTSGGSCPATPTIPVFALLRMSPESRGGLAYPAPPQSEADVATTTNPLAGIWLLQGSGVILAVGRTGPLPAVGFRLDGQGTFDAPADDDGSLTVVGPGRVFLHTPSQAACDIVLTGVEAGSYTFTATVVSDPCRRFGGAATLAWTLLE